jgi:MFS family permease
MSRYRWWIGSLLLGSTIINYIDRQTLSVLAPILKSDYHWSNQDFALIVIAFRIAYATMQAVSGRVIDRLGTRRGMTLAVAWYSTIAMLTASAGGLWSFCTFRFLLGAGEAANWPAATKAVSEWFPRRERGWAVALFDSGSSIGAAVAPVFVLWLHARVGSWRPAFLITGSLGFLWLLVWRRSYYLPADHPRISSEERAMLAADHAAESADADAAEHANAVATRDASSNPGARADSHSHAAAMGNARMSAVAGAAVHAGANADASATSTATDSGGATAGAGSAATSSKPTPVSRLLALPQTWGCIAARSLTDPVWYMITDWFAVFLVTRGFKLEETLVGFWVPFIAADIGNFFGGGLSSILIARGWPVGRARKLLLVLGSAGVLALAPAAFLQSFPALIACFALATFSYATASTMALALPADLYRSRDVASISGMCGAGAGVGTILSTFLIGVVADRFSFGPILVVASAVPLGAAILTLLLVRAPTASEADVVNAI